MATTEAQRAHYLVTKALERGVLTRSDTCELCGVKPHLNESGYLINSQMVAHHHAGYQKENALNVWWLCWGCNARLHGHHDGSLTIDQAREFVFSFSKPPNAPVIKARRCSYELAPGLKCMTGVGKSGSEYCHHHRGMIP